MRVAKATYFDAVPVARVLAKADRTALKASVKAKIDAADVVDAQALEAEVLVTEGFAAKNATGNTVAAIIQELVDTGDYKTGESFQEADDLDLEPEPLPI